MQAASQHGFLKVLALSCPERHEEESLMVLQRGEGLQPETERSGGSLD